MKIHVNAIPDAPPADPVMWAERVCLKVDGHAFDGSLCPQSAAPMRSMSIADKMTRIGTYIKPVQSGGSTAGEAITAYWCAYAFGLIQQNWQDDLKAGERWADRILPCLQSAALPWAGGRDAKICEGRFANTILRVQGVFNENALNSDTVPYQLNEEVHLWKPGHLSMARDRQTRIWNSKALDISNASRTGTQLHLAFQEGTMQEWLTACPKCGVKHAMHFRWNPDKPELGGLRWDSSTRLPDGRPNYNRLEQTIRYQFPCGHEVGADPVSRRMVGEYSEPRNEGAHLSHRSWTSEAVSYDQISWLTLIKEWHQAIQALKSGDSEPMFRFVTRRECKFYDPENDLPYHGKIIVNNTIVKSRDGLKDRAARFWFADKQKGYVHRGEMTHYWLVIRDVMLNADSQLVYEGMAQTDADLISRLTEHNCLGQSGAVDCGWDRANVLQFCYRNNFNAQTTSPQDRLFYHRDEKAYRIYSEIEPLCKQIAAGFPTKFKVGTRVVNGIVEQVIDPEEPKHWNIHRIGSIKLLFFLRNHRQISESNGLKDFIKWELPGDVSEEYKKQIESWEFTQRKVPATNSMAEVCRQRFQSDHMLMCEAGIANLMAMSGILPARLAALGISESVISQPPT